MTARPVENLPDPDVAGAAAVRVLKTVAHLKRGPRCREAVGTVASVVLRLRDNPRRRQIVEHAFFGRVKTTALTREDVAVFLGQWWHPLHYFPTFLARCVAVLPDIESKSAIARILNQETGGGTASRAHEVVYVDTMRQAGFSREQVSEAAPFRETAALVAGYERAATAPLSAVGFIFATEVIDLVMVSGIGHAVRRVTGERDLEWVKIHMEQEPDHVEDATSAVVGSFSADQEARIVVSAEEMWRLWAEFFDRLEREIAGLARNAQHGSRAGGDG